MYLIKSFTLTNNCVVVTFDLFDKDGEPVLIESALEASGSRTIKAHDGYEEVDERLWELDLLCDGDPKVDRAIHILQMFVKEFYGSR